MSKLRAQRPLLTRRKDFDREYRITHTRIFAALAKKKTDLTRKAWKIDQQINKQTVEFEKKIDRFLNGVYNTE